MFLVGIPESRPLVGAASGIAAEAGIDSGDLFVSVDGVETRTWSHTILELVAHGLDRRAVDVVTEDAPGMQSEHPFN